MSTTMDFALRGMLTELRPDGRLAVLMALVLHANARNRCWPSTDTLARETGYSVPTVVAAKQWLAEHKAFRLVAYELRAEEEKDLPQRQFIYQLSGVLRLDDGRIERYLYMSEEAYKAAVDRIRLEDKASEVKPSKTLPGLAKVFPSFQVNPERKDTLTNVNGHNSNNEKNTLQEDASTPTHEQSPHTTETHPPIPADAQPPSRPRKADLDAQYDAIAETWNTSTSGLITNLRGMLFGSVNVRGEWKQNAIAPALSIDELRAFAAYAKRRMLETTNGRNQDMPTKAVTIALWVEQFRRERADAQAREQERVVLVADETPMDAGAGAGARVTAQQGVDVSAIPF